MWTWCYSLLWIPSVFSPSEWQILHRKLPSEILQNKIRYQTQLSMESFPIQLHFPETNFIENFSILFYLFLNLKMNWESDIPRQILEESRKLLELQKYLGFPRSPGRRQRLTVCWIGWSWRTRGCWRWGRCGSSKSPRTRTCDGASVS